MGSSARARRQENYDNWGSSASETEEYERQIQYAQQRVDNGPSSGEYTQGEASEFYNPTNVSVPATPFGQPGTKDDVDGLK